ncbi:MAG: hypothetical protein ABL914_12375 [Novosphingobium sp.]|uniref:hypothetical protein n=1 Tax=Novosphingobium sp. TaxID=1874826 RepID=UPI0032BD2027
MTIKTAGLALLLSLGAAPAVAKEAVNSAAITAHLEGLITQNYTDCYNEAQHSPIERVVFCKAGLDEVNASRNAAPQASIAEKSNFDFVESTLLSGLALGYSQIDKRSSTRFCTTIERVWVLRHGLLAIAENELPADAFRAYHDVPPALGKIVGQCRGEFGTPEGAPPMP